MRWVTVLLRQCGVEIAAAPHDECLVHGILQTVVSVLGDAVFVALAAIDAGGPDTVVLQQGGVIGVKCPATAALQFVGGGGGIVGTHHLRYAAQGPECILHSLLEGQEGLAGGDLSVTPARVAEDQLEQQVVIGLASDGHPQGVAVGEIKLGFPTRRMLLGEVNLLIWAIQRPPIL